MRHVIADSRGQPQSGTVIAPLSGKFWARLSRDVHRASKVGTVGEFLERLKQRKLVQWALAYVAAAFALML